MQMLHTHGHSGIIGNDGGVTGSYCPQSGQVGHTFGTATFGCWLHWRVHSWWCTQRCSPKSKRVGQAQSCSTGSNPPTTVPRHCQNMFGSAWGHKKCLLPLEQLAPHWAGWLGWLGIGHSGHHAGTSLEPGFRESLQDEQVAGLRLGWFNCGRFHWARAVTARQLKMMNTAEIFKS